MKKVYNPFLNNLKKTFKFKDFVFTFWSLLSHEKRRINQIINQENLFLLRHDLKKLSLWQKKHHHQIRAAKTKLLSVKEKKTCGKERTKMVEIHSEFLENRSIFFALSITNNLQKSKADFFTLCFHFKRCVLKSTLSEENECHKQLQS